VSAAKKEPASGPRIKAAAMTPEHAQSMSEALSTYNADHGTAVAALKQLSDDLGVLLGAMMHGTSDVLVLSTLAAIQQRAQAAADLAGDIDEVLAITTHRSEAAQ
jgi:hypothetical protein